MNVQAVNLNFGAESQTGSKSAKKRGVEAVCLGIGAAAGLIFLYNKGMGQIKYKDKIFNGAKNFDEFVKQKGYSETDINELKKIWDKGEKLSNGITGKVHNAFNSISSFFQKNFYNY